MILRLYLRDFAIVEQATLEFAPGLNALTGETGAGKSILVDALGFLAGGRATAEWVRRGAARMSVEGVLALRGDTEPERHLRRAAAAAGISLDPEAGEELVLRREMGADGRSRCLVNGQQVLVADLRALTARVLWIVGQGEQRALGEPAEQLWLLDRYGRTLDLRERYQETRELFLQAGQALQDLGLKRDLFLKEEDWLVFQAKEILEAAVRPGERGLLLEGRRLMREKAHELELADEVDRRLFREEGSVADHLESLLHLLGSRSGDGWEEIRRKLLEMRETVRNLRGELPSAATAGLEEEFQGPEELEERLRLLDRLCRKYGGDEEAVLRHGEEVQARLAEGEALELSLAGAGREWERLRAELGRLGSDLSERRRRAAVDLARLAGREFPGLGMAGAALEYSFQEEEDPEGVPSEGRFLRPLESGLEKVRLLFRPHAAEPQGELSRMASGGELSRVLLALHVSMGESSPPGCWILDEVDAGIGGETARHVGARLAEMAARAQVLLVTHLPVIAALAGRHLRVSKREKGGRPSAEVDALEGEQRVREVARMLSGEVDAPIALRHARELLESARSAPRPARGH